MKRISLVLAGLALACGTFSALGQWSQEVELYHWVDFPIDVPDALTDLEKWDVQGSCRWTHEDGVTRRTSLLWYSGSGTTYVYRFGASLQGRWTGTTTSPIKALDGQELTVDVAPSSNPDRTGWSGPLPEELTAWARQQGSEGELVKRTPILIMMPNVPAAIFPTFPETMTAS